MHTATRFAFVAWTVFAAAACEEPEVDAWAPGEIDPAGLPYRYLIDEVDLPDTMTEAETYGMVLDGNSIGRPNNALGQILTVVFAHVDSDLDRSANRAITDGRSLHLLEVQATSLADAAGVGVQIFLGVDRDDPGDNFSGFETFDLVDGPASQPLTGEIVRGRLAADLGVVPLRIALPHVDRAFTLELEAAQIEADVITPTTVEGRIGGALSEQAVHDQLLPLILASLEGSIALDCDAGTCEPDSHGALFLELFDADGDGALTLDELASSSLVASLLLPDIDLFDADGNYGPRTDGVKDALSVGLRFTAVPARFTPTR
jgi:hypothetical protein